jgi:hypothetical protein
MFGKASYSYPWDEIYRTGSRGTFPVAPENAKQLIPGPRSLGSFAVTNVGNNLVWVAYWDTLTTGPNPTPASIALSDSYLLNVIPVPAPGYYQASVHAGTDLIYGLWAGAYSTQALALAGGVPDAGNVLWYKVEYGGTRILPQVS